MEKAVAIRLIEKGIDKTPSKQCWMDLGAGDGFFTEALAILLSKESLIYAVDNDAKALKKIELVEKDIILKKLKKDFSKEALDVNDLDGILMANSLHFIDNKAELLLKLKSCLKPAGKFIFVEYDTDIPNPWVPYPVSRSSLEKLVKQTGLQYLTQIGEVPSIYNRANLYSAVGGF